MSSEQRSSPGNRVKLSAFLVVAIAQATVLVEAGGLSANESPSSAGHVIGIVFGVDGTTPLEGIMVEVHEITTNRRLASDPTGSDGSFHVDGVSAGVLGFTLRDGDGQFAVVDRVDARFETDFVLRACFSLDRGEGVASLLERNCDPELPPGLATAVEEKSRRTVVFALAGATAAASATIFLIAARETETSPIR